MKITLMLFLICLLNQVLPSKMKDLKASHDKTVKRLVNYLINDNAEGYSPSNIDSTKRRRHISKGNKRLALRNWLWSNKFSMDTNSPHNNVYVLSQPKPASLNNNDGLTQPKSALHKHGKKRLPQSRRY